ncbi:MAG: carboxypeptidase regulatory-like domain-containing protein [Planctomycetes bacterium]|nr:carboxypeptidase regulatory-like domain-containing protein [Planctomycetota bacterium]
MRVVDVGGRMGSAARLPRPFVVLILAVLSGGCSENDNLAEVRGHVTLDGQPLADAFVVLSPTTAGTTSYGRTDEAGNYEMMFSESERGAWIGENLVRINTGDVGAGGGPGKPERVPAVYNRNTTLKVDVQPAENTLNFDLKSNAGRIIAAPVE